jgi:hypothetical protein
MGAPMCDFKLEGPGGYIRITNKEILIHGPSGEIRTPNLAQRTGVPAAIPVHSDAPPGHSSGKPQQLLAAAHGAGGSALGPGAKPPLQRYGAEFHAASAATGVPADLLAAIAWAESRGNPNVAGGGMMQFDPNTFAYLKHKYPNLIKGGSDDPASNIMAAGLYMKELHAQFGGWQLAMRAYNSGPNAVNLSDPNAIKPQPGAPVTGVPEYVRNVTNYWNTISNGGELPP